MAAKKHSSIPASDEHRSYGQRALLIIGADARRIDQLRIALGEQIERDAGNLEAIDTLLARIAKLAQDVIERVDLLEPAMRGRA